MARVCPRCTTTNNDTARYCMNCGGPLGDASTPRGPLPHETGHLTHGTLLNDRYLIHERVGGGGQAAVYRAMDTRLDHRLVAVKEMSVAGLSAAELREASALAQQEAHLLARLRHPNLPSVFDFFAGPDGRQYMVMDFIEGVSLEKLLESRGGQPFPEEQVRGWARQLCDVLDFLHAQTPAPIIFRDLKPANIMIEAGDLVKLVDFGIARLFRPGKATDTTRLGTPGYASPEHHSGQTDARSDIYGLGATLLRLSTGYDPSTTPFRLPEARAVNPAISPALEALIRSATNLDPALRFQSAAALRAALDAPLGSAPTGGQGRTTVVSPPPAKRSPWLTVAVAFVLLAVGGALVFLLTRGPGGTAGAPTPSEATADTAVGNDTPEETTPLPTDPPPATPDKQLAATAEALAATATAQARLLDDGTATAAAIPPTATPTATAEARGALPATREDGYGMVMVLVPAGPFLRGSTEDDIAQAMATCRGNSDGDPCGRSEFASELPQRVITLSDYYIDQMEVSNGMYARCVAARACSPPAAGDGPYRRSAYYDSSNFRDHPVVWVTWDDAQDYCQWAGKRLPTEAEWEKAARGEDGWIYPWGDVWDSARARTQDGGGQTIAWIGGHGEGASPYGALNMAGNVWEYVADWYDPDYYAVAPDRDPPGPDGSPSGDHVLRGGSYGNFRYYARAANRGLDARFPATQYRGFRCVLPIAP